MQEYLTAIKRLRRIYFLYQYLARRVWFCVDAAADTKDMRGGKKAHHHPPHRISIFLFWRSTSKESPARSLLLEDASGEGFTLVRATTTAQDYFLAHKRKHREKKKMILQNHLCHSDGKRPNKTFPAAQVRHVKYWIWHYQTQEEWRTNNNLLSVNTSCFLKKQSTICRKV